MAITTTLSCCINFSSSDFWAFYLPSDYLILQIARNMPQPSSLINILRATTSYAAQDALFYRYCIHGLWR